MKYLLKVTGLVITLTAATAMAPRVAQATAQTPLATQLGVSVHPKNNQDQGQQTKDENECYSLAKQQTGIDPAAPPPQQAQDAKGSGAKGAAKGAAVGAVHGRRKEKRADRQAQQTQQRSTSTVNGRI